MVMCALSMPRPALYVSNHMCLHYFSSFLAAESLACLYLLMPFSPFPPFSSFRTVDNRCRQSFLDKSQWCPIKVKLGFYLFLVLYV